MGINQQGFPANCREWDLIPRFDSRCEQTRQQDGIDLHGRRQSFAQQLVRNLIGLAALERVRRERREGRVRAPA